MTLFLIINDSHRSLTVLKTCGIFTLHGNGTGVGTGAGNWTSTTENNKSWFSLLSFTSVKILLQHIIPVQCE